MKYEDTNFEGLCLVSPDVTGYADEFILSLWINDGILEIGCQPLKVDGKYTNPCGDITYLLEDCSSKLISLCDGSTLYFVNIGDEYDHDEECGECCPCDCHCGDSCVEYSKTDDGELHGFTASKSTGTGYHSYSFYTSDTLSKSDIHDMLKEFGF